MIAGGVMVFVWKYGIATMSDALAIYELLPAFIIALLVNVVVSLATAEPSDEIVKTFEEVAVK
jgi:sodium/proline symporter